MGSRTWLLLAAWLPLVSACSLFDPKAGPSQTCGDQAASGSNPYGPAGGDASGTCWADAGSPCDDCESKWCCHTRLSCYADPVCNCADMNMNTCQDLASSDAAAADASRAAALCWDAFSASGHVATARVACVRAWCQQVCAVP